MTAPTRTPGSVLRSLVGTLDRFAVRGLSYVYTEQVPPIDRAADLQDQLEDNVERAAAWRRIVGACRNDVDKARDELEGVRAQLGVLFWQQLEDKERREMREQVHDETETAQDQADQAAGDDGWKARRSARVARRVQGGLAAGRWRPNFTDDLVRYYVNSESQTITAKTALRQAQCSLERAEAVLYALDQRSYTLSNITKIHCDSRRQ